MMKPFKAFHPFKLGVIMKAIGSWLPTRLFSDLLTKGVWYDPNDINLTWRRNLLTYSEQFDNAAWVKIRCTVVPNATASPDGTVTAEKLVEDTSLNSHPIATTISVISGQLSTLSVYAKASERTRLQLSANAGGAFCTFDLSSGAVVAGVGLISSAGSGWYRCQITYVPTASSDTVYIWPVVSGTTNNYQGDGTSGIYIWGAQLEVGSTATPYQKITNVTQDYPTYQSQPILYQDAAGTTPVTAVGQPVGLMLDKSKGLVLGPELVTNGDFSNGTTGWTSSGVTLSIVSEALRAVGIVTGNYVASSGFSVVAGRTYRFQFSVKSDVVSSNITFGLRTVSAPGVFISNTVTPSIGTSFGLFTFYITPTVNAADATFVIRYGAAESINIDNISVRELPGNHAYNPSGNSANFPVLSARYNLLTKTEDFSDAAWVKTNLTATANKLTSANLTGIQAVDSTSAAYPAGVYIFSIKVKSDGWRWVQLRTNITLSASYVNFDVISGVKGTESGAIGSITALGANEYLISIRLTFLAASGAIAIQLVDSGTAARNPSAIGDGVSVIFVRDADLRVANDALNQPIYQRVNTTTDYDTVGFKPYLSFNGVNQWLQTNSIDFSYGDKMFVSAGVRKLSDAASGMLAELSADLGNNTGAFCVVAPSAAGANSYRFSSKGSLGSGDAGTGVFAAAPTTNIISGIGNISAPSAILRVNESQNAQSTATQGTGNYGNYPLYIGARAGSSLWFNGRLYGLVIAGKSASASEIASTEAWLNKKTGAY